MRLAGCAVGRREGRGKQDAIGSVSFIAFAARARIHLQLFRMSSKRKHYSAQRALAHTERTEQNDTFYFPKGYEASTRGITAERFSRAYRFFRKTIHFVTSEPIGGTGATLGCQHSREPLSIHAAITWANEKRHPKYDMFLVGKQENRYTVAHPPPSADHSRGSM